MEPVSGYAAKSALSATKTDTPILEIPQGVTVVTRDLIQDRVAQDTNDALATVAGFVPSGTYNFDQAYTLRGFTLVGDSFYQKTRDGRRFPSVIPIDPDVLERIEVIKGPSSVLYGQIEPGGIVNHVSKRAQLGYTAGFVEQRFGSYDQFKTIIDVNASLSADAALRMPATFSTGNSFRDEVEYETFDIAPAATWKIDDRTRVSLLTTLGRKEGTDDTIGKPFVNGVVLDVPRDRFLGEPSFDQKISYGSVTAELEHKLTPDLLWRSSYTYFEAHRDIEYALNFQFFPPPPGFLARGGGTDVGYQRGHATQHDLVWDTRLLGMKHKIVTGFDGHWADRDTLINIGVMNPIDIDNPDYDPAIFPPFIFDNYRSMITSQQLGLYAQDEITLLERAPGVHKLTLLLGGRWDWAKEDLETSGTIFFAPTANAKIENDAFSPRAALLYMPIEGLSVYGSYSESFNPQDPEQVSGIAQTNPEPTLGKQYEVGAKLRLARNLYATAALFDITKTNIPTTPPGSFFSVLTGEVRSRGLELELNGEILPGWQIASGYAAIDTEITEDEFGNVGNRLTGAAEHQFGIWTSYTFQPGTALAGVGGGTGLTYVGDIFADNENTINLPSYTLWDASLWYRPEPTGAPVNFEYQLTVRNITDEEYLVGGNGFSAVQDGTARTVIGSIKAKF